MWNILLLLLVLITAILILFNIPYSKLKKEFNDVVKEKINQVNKTTEVFSEEDIQNLPGPVKKYFMHCGYMGKPKMNYMRAEFKNVDFKISSEKTIKIDYTQYNFVNKPDRFALIDSSLFGVPFEGFDSYNDGIGSMKGTIAKLFTLFDQRGDDMDKACLVTYLAECLMLPNAALQDFITWEEVDETHAKATISYYGIVASGVFAFDEDGLWLSFKTSDRVATSMDGSKREADWSAIVSSYHEDNGILRPKSVKSIWHYEDGAFVYFNENNSDFNVMYY